MSDPKLDGTYVDEIQGDIPEHYWSPMEASEAIDIAKKAQTILRLQFWKGFAVGVGTCVIIQAVLIALIR